MSLPAAFSTNVVLRLQIDETELELSHVGSSKVVVRGPAVEHPPGNATLSITVDGNCRTRTIFLPHGIQAGNPDVAYF
jgi:hypothetical protein